MKTEKQVLSTKGLAKAALNLFLVMVSILGFGQTGPGGVGSTSGSASQPANQISEQLT